MRSGWQTKAIGDVCTIRPPKSEARAALNPRDLVSFVPMEDLPIGSKSIFPKQERPLSDVVNGYTYFADGDVLLAKITPCFENGKLGIARELKNGIGFGSSEYIVLRPDSTLTSDWLYYYLARESFRREGTSRMSGAVGHKRVPKEFVEKYSIPVPPISEQKRMVAILDQVFASIDASSVNSEKNLLTAQTLFEANLHRVFERRDSSWVDFDRPLAELCDLIVDCEHKTAPCQDEGIPSIRTPNVGKGKLLLEGVNRVSERTYKEWTRRAEPMAGDLIFAREAPAGNVAVVPDNLRVCLGQRTVLIRPKRSLFEPAFLAYALLQPCIQQTLLAHSRGATVEHVNMKDIRALDIGAIPPLTIQKQLVEQIEGVAERADSLASIIARKIAAMATLKQSFLHHAFTGAL
jgi:type I restriction enzyme, S subunit